MSRVTVTAPAEPKTVNRSLDLDADGGRDGPADGPGAGEVDGPIAAIGPTRGRRAMAWARPDDEAGDRARDHQIAQTGGEADEGGADGKSEGQADGAVAATQVTKS